MLDWPVLGGQYWMIVRDLNYHETSSSEVMAVDCADEDPLVCWCPFHSVRDSEIQVQHCDSLMKEKVESHSCCLPLQSDTKIHLKYRKNCQHHINLRLPYCCRNDRHYLMVLLQWIHRGRTEIGKKSVSLSFYGVEGSHKIIISSLCHLWAAVKHWKLR